MVEIIPLATGALDAITGGLAVTVLLTLLLKPCLMLWLLGSEAEAGSHRLARDIGWSRALISASLLALFLRQCSIAVSDPSAGLAGDRK
ncbi:hypothetical protein PYH37_005203 [Sinorhizobium numidicum]|uniref:Uncharacterized protein n=1 Tax=Sinorhizobium numidicum TaxID=680248 RepID=A0ABY8D1U4_9HYPH|nr:hypothetical protein [Sinorhizobium numidicum]WEX76854.1 hypothetical protein PYH37_005203 [Sinorhizobium numidicum]WEX83515.1 hypothetical protein PYH38_002296 [Sinorhizobium numidicum]